MLCSRLVDRREDHPLPRIDSETTRPHPANPKATVATKSYQLQEVAHQERKIRTRGRGLIAKQRSRDFSEGVCQIPCVAARYFQTDVRAVTPGGMLRTPFVLFGQFQILIPGVGGGEYFAATAPEANLARFRLMFMEKTPVRTSMDRLLQLCERLVYDLFSVGVLPYRTHSTTGPRRSDLP